MAFLGGVFLRKLLQIMFVHCCKPARMEFGGRLSSLDFGAGVQACSAPLTSAPGLLQPEWKQLVLNTHISV